MEVMQLIINQITKSFEVLFQEFQLPIGISLGHFIISIILIKFVIDKLLPFLKTDRADKNEWGTMNTGQYDRQILNELQEINGNTDNIESDLDQIYSRQGELLTEIRDIHTDIYNKLDTINTTLSDGFIKVIAIVVVATAVKVLFRNAWIT